MVDINNIVSRGGYLVDGVTGEKVLFYECDPRKNTECNREMCRGAGLAAVRRCVPHRLSWRDAGF